LNEKYNPVFEEMHKTILEKRKDYMDYLTRQLLKNDEIIRKERGALPKIQGALQSIQEAIKKELESQQTLIKEIEENQQK
jgi:hypothetical protein